MRTSRPARQADKVSALAIDLPRHIRALARGIRQQSKFFTCLPDSCSTSAIPADRGSPSLERKASHKARQSLYKRYVFSESCLPSHKCYQQPHKEGPSCRVRFFLPLAAHMMIDIIIGPTRATFPVRLARSPRIGNPVSGRFTSFIVHPSQFSIGSVFGLR